MKTVDEIYRAMMETFARETGMEPDGTGEVAVRMYALAAQVYGLYEEADWTRRQCFPQTATGEDLEKHAWLRGLSRSPASRAGGVLRFSVPTAAGEELAIPAGTVCLTAGLVAFETIEEAVLPAGSLFVDVPARAVQPGAGGNAPAGTIRAMAVAPVGVAACTNPAAFTGGRGEETDEALRERVLASYQHLPNGTNAAYYEQQALSVEGVAAVNVSPKSRGLGTVDIYVAGPDGLPTEGLLAAVSQRLDSRREIAVDLQVLTPAAVPVNVLLAVRPKSGFLTETVLNRVEEAVQAWFDGTRLGQDVLLAQLGQLIYQVDGVENYRIDAPASDVTIGRGQLPVLGNLSVEMLP